MSSIDCFILLYTRYLGKHVINEMWSCGGVWLRNLALADGYLIIQIGSDVDCLLR